MTVKSVVLTVLLMVAILLAAACTSPSDGTPTTVPTTATPVPTTAPVTAPPTTSVSITPGPTDPMPANLQAEFQVDPKDPIYANVRVAYRGGTATIHITHIDVILTKADGTVIKKTLPESGTRKVQAGDEVVMQGTRQTDRLQVTVTLDNGNIYRVIDQLIPFQTRP